MTLDETLELLADVVSALDAAHVELLQLDDTSVPLPLSVLKELRERDALVATFRRIPEKAREALRTPYREEHAKATRGHDGVGVPVCRDVLARLAEIDELLRRRALVDSQLGDALAGRAPVDVHRDGEIA